ncbi:hypothetical protein VTL71DRAFT_3388 [Oculimacula yallundae]|uniref:SnoaL-like domain-containing protein n=1 Tax=Oculimacula yallundae TaxID=86028 RepID=A0ABR4C700_9HELO
MLFQPLLAVLLASLATATASRSGHPSAVYTHPSSSPESSIRNVLAHYCIILDTKTYPSLSEVYTSDAVANFTTIGLGVLNGLPAIQKAMNVTLGDIPTVHEMTSSWIYDVDVKGGEAKGVTYYTLQQFGTGEQAGRLFTVWGKWEDKYVFDDGWKIQNRQVLLMGGPLIGHFEVPAH